MGVNLYTFGVVLGPPNADFGPRNGALGPLNIFLDLRTSAMPRYVHTTLDILNFRGFMFRNA